MPRSAHEPLRGAPGRSSRDEPSWDPGEGRWCHPPLEGGPHPPHQAVWALGLLGGRERMLRCPTGLIPACECTHPPLPACECTHTLPYQRVSAHTPSPTCICVHTQPLLPLTWPPGSPEASLGTHGVNPAICQLCLAASASPAPTPYEPSWKAASLLAGRAGGWAWEAPGVSRSTPLPQHLQGLNSVGSCCPAGAPLELTHTCRGVVHQEAHTPSLCLSLSLSGSNTHRPARQYLNTVSLYQRKQTHRNPLHKPTRSVCTTS